MQMDSSIGQSDKKLSTYGNVALVEHRALPSKLISAPYAKPHVAHNGKPHDVHIVKHPVVHTVEPRRCGCSRHRGPASHPPVGQCDRRLEKRKSHTLGNARIRFRYSIAHSNWTFVYLAPFFCFANASPLDYHHIAGQSTFSLTTFFSNWLVSWVFLHLTFITVSRSRDVLSKVFVGFLLAALFLVAGPALWKAGVRIDQAAGFVLSFVALQFSDTEKCPNCDKKCGGRCGQGGSGGSNDPGA
ncbi:hypothetical protein B0O99DRAFT_695011 [Bisporella sp. PMI_857]|nr:hypothetical protein B0O99DRAFT_695011 [Bisporella sp. PMI_857]